MTALCPRCHAPVLPCASGALEPEPHPLGVLGPDGEPLTRREVVAGYLAGAPVGRRRHQCSPPSQGELFPMPGRTDKTGSRRG